MSRDAFAHNYAGGYYKDTVYNSLNYTASIKAVLNLNSSLLQSPIYPLQYTSNT